MYCGRLHRYWRTVNVAIKEGIEIVTKQECNMTLPLPDAAKPTSAQSTLPGNRKEMWRQYTRTQRSNSTKMGGKLMCVWRKRSSLSHHLHSRDNPCRAECMLFLLRRSCTVKSWPAAWFGQDPADSMVRSSHKADNPSVPLFMGSEFSSQLPDFYPPVDPTLSGQI